MSLDGNSGDESRPNRPLIPLNPTSSPSAVVDNFFRHEYGKTVSYLVGRFGSDNLDKIEDAVQDCLLTAMKTWPLQGIPDAPAAWVLRSSTNRLIDVLRRKKNLDVKKEVIKKSSSNVHEELDSETILKDDLLRMMFVCCHPDIKLESRVILTLKILCGLGVQEIASALLKKDDAVRKAYNRAKNHLANLDIGRSDEPVDESRLPSVLQVLYLLFTEGHSSSSGEDLLKSDLCLDAMRLGQLLLEHRPFHTSDTYGLLALFCYLASRLESRVDAEGKLIPLDKQDRSLWNKELIKYGDYYLSVSTSSGPVTRYQVEAAIAGLHSNAKSIDDVNWNHVLFMYDALVDKVPGPASHVNRIIALSKVEGPKSALGALENISNQKGVQDYYLFHAVKADLLSSLGKNDQAISSLESAISLTKNKAEQDFLRERIQNL